MRKWTVYWLAKQKRNTGSVALRTSQRGRRRWRAMDIGRSKVYVESKALRVRYWKHGVVTAAVPWVRQGSRFTRIFEETTAWLSIHGARSTVAEYMRVEWHTVGGICRRVYQEMEEKNPSRFNGLVNIGIDETTTIRPVCSGVEKNLGKRASPNFLKG